MKNAPQNALLDIPVTTINGESSTLGYFLGKATLIVNVASKCGFTPQYAGLQQLFDEFRDRGLTVLGFPCDQFGHQEPGDEAQIKNFCSSSYGVGFPMFTKIEVNGPGTHPLYRYLKVKAPGFLGLTRVNWNFTKFLVSKDPVAVRRYAPTTKPQSVRADIVRLVGGP